jgi:TldD protein
MSHSLEIAQQQLLHPVGMELTDVQRTLDQLCTRAIDQADLYFESTRSESWFLEDGIVKEGSYNIDQGVGVRAVSGEKTGFAYSDEIILPALRQAASTAKCIAASGKQRKFQAWHQTSAPAMYRDSNPLLSLAPERKIQLLQTIDTLARERNPRVKQVIANLSGQHTTVLVAGIDGIYAADVRPLVRLNVSVIAEENGRREHGVAGGGGRFGYEYFLDADRYREYVDEAVQQALINLESIAAPAGTMTVVLGPGWPGILLHEAIGHGLEGDFNRKGTSAFSNRLGQRVAAAGVTVVDDGTLPERRGSLSVDDEGTPTQCTTLIENGILRNYMQDKLNARLMGMPCTGNGRRESYAHLPLPRMTNTYMLAGPHDPQEIIASVTKGLYASHFGGGQVDITNGNFVFSASQAWLIESGRLTRPVKGATLIGNGPEVLTRVSMIGNDLQFDTGVGVCGKDGQSVPVGVGQPTLRIEDLTVGGTGQ